MSTLEIPVVETPSVPAKPASVTTETVHYIHDVRVEA